MNTKMKNELIKAMFVILQSKITTDNMRECVKIELLDKEITITFIPSVTRTFNYTEILNVVCHPLYYYAQIDGKSLVYHIY